MCAPFLTSCQAVPALTPPVRGEDRELLQDSGFLLYVVSYICTALGLDSDLFGARYQGPCTREAAAGHLPALAKAMVGLCKGRPALEVPRMACVLPVLAPLLAHTVGRACSACDAGEGGVEVTGGGAVFRESFIVSEERGGCCWGVGSVATVPAHLAVNGRHIGGDSPPPPHPPTLTQSQTQQDVDVVASACRVAAILADDERRGKDCVIQAGLVPRLVKLMGQNGSPEVREHALRAVGNLVTGTDEHTQVCAWGFTSIGGIGSAHGKKGRLWSRLCFLRFCDELACMTQSRHPPPPTILMWQAVVDAGVLSELLWLVGNSTDTMLREACWTMSNICAGSEQQRQVRLASVLCPPPNRRC